MKKLKVVSLFTQMSYGVPIFLKPFLFCYYHDIENSQILVVLFFSQEED